jgi:hypothetical protein
MSLFLRGTSQAIKKGMEARSKEIAEKGAELYAEA